MARYMWHTINGKIADTNSLFFATEMVTNFIVSIWTLELIRKIAFAQWTIISKYCRYGGRWIGEEDMYTSIVRQENDRP